MSIELSDLIFALEMIGTVAFAISGVVVAKVKKMDIFGACLLGCTTACGGGAIRDLMLGEIPPMMFQTPIYVLVAFVTSLVMFVVFYHAEPAKDGSLVDKLLNLADSLGLAAFVVVGFQGAMRAGYADNRFLCVFVGVLTGIGGGILRDILAGQMPLIMSKRVYGVAAILGAITYDLCLRRAGSVWATVLALVVTCLIRFLAIHYRWNLPKLS